MDSQASTMEKILSNPLYPLLQLTLLGIIWVLEYFGVLTGNDFLGRFLMLLILVLLLGKLAWTRQPTWWVMVVALLGIACTFFDSFISWVLLLGSNQVILFFVIYGGPIMAMLFFVVIIYSCFLQRNTSPEKDEASGTP